MKQSQNQKILEYLQSGLAITQKDSIRMFDCYRLAARIKDLREQGHDIQESKGKGERHSTYRLVKKHGTGTLFALPAKGRPE